MFFLKSAFWLTVMFLIMAPHGTDLAATLAGMRQDAMSAGLRAGQDLIVSQILANDPVGTGSISSAPSIDLPMQDSSSSIPFPRPRPDWMG